MLVITDDNLRSSLWPTDVQEVIDVFGWLLTALLSAIIVPISTWPRSVVVKNSVLLIHA